MGSYLELPDDRWEAEHERFQETDVYTAALAVWVEDTGSLARLRSLIGQTAPELDTEFQMSNNYADCFERWHEERLLP